MSTPTIKDEAIKLWKTVAKENDNDEIAQPLHLELEFYKRILNFFQAGDYYYYVFNFNTIGLDVVSAGIKKVLGYDLAEFTASAYMDNIHPEDMPYFLAFETLAAEFLTQLPLEKIMKYKVRYDIRIKQKSGNYIRILRQGAIIEHDDEGKMIRSLGVDTDITHLKSEGKPVLSFIGMDDEESYYNIEPKCAFIKSKELLTKREKQILLILIQGKLSKEIASLLNISKLTVDSHRKNMIRKHNVGNTGELIARAIREGWV